MSDRSITKQQTRSIRSTAADTTATDLLAPKWGGLITGWIAKLRSFSVRAVDEAEALQARSRADALEAGIQLAEVAERAYDAEARIRAVQDNLEEIQANKRARVLKEYEAAHKTELAELDEQISRADARLNDKRAAKRRKTEALEMDADLTNRRRAAAEKRSADGAKRGTAAQLAKDERAIDKEWERLIESDTDPQSRARKEELRDQKKRQLRHRYLSQEDGD